MDALLADFVSQLLLMGAPRTVLTSPLDQLVVHSLVSTSQALGCSPGLHVPVRLALFLENLSYSFDASQMVMAVLLNVRGPVQISLSKTALPDFAPKANLL